MTEWFKDFIFMLCFITYLASAAAPITYGMKLLAEQKPHWQWWIAGGTVYFTATIVLVIKSPHYAS